MRGKSAARLTENDQFHGCTGLILDPLDRTIGRVLLCLKDNATKASGIRMTSLGFNRIRLAQLAPDKLNGIAYFCAYFVLG